MAKKKSKPLDYEKLIDEITIELKKEGDRGLSILTVAYLDHLLKDLIVSRMNAGEEESYKLLFDIVYAPLGSFAAKITVSYCLGLIDIEQSDDLNKMRDIRNLFAHRLLEISSFESEDVRTTCKSLKSSMVDGQPSTARECYLKASIRLMMDILIKIKDSENE